jgi:hypothetical protein
MPSPSPATADLTFLVDAAALPAIAAALGPGASIMVRYGDDDTERALRVITPPAARRPVHAPGP